MKFLLIFFISISYVFAAQQVYINKGDAERVKNILKSETTLYQYCEPCGDVFPKAITINKVTMEQDNLENQYMILVNNTIIDLAYSYAIIKEQDYLQNLAKYLELPALDVSEKLNIQEMQERIRCANGYLQITEVIQCYEKAMQYHDERVNHLYELFINDIKKLVFNEESLNNLLKSLENTQKSWMKWRENACQLDSSLFEMIYQTDKTQYLQCIIAVTKTRISEIKAQRALLNGEIW